MNDVIPEDLTTEMMRLSKLIDEGVDGLYKASKNLAEAEHAYRKGKAEAWFAIDSSLVVPHRQAEVDARTADLRKSRDMYEGLRQTALEALRARRSQLSVLQSMMNAYKAQADFDRTMPREMA